MTPPRPPKAPRDDDTPTPVEGVPIEPLQTIAHRTRSAATDAKATLDTVTTLREDLKEADERNKLEHKRTSDKIGVLDDRVLKLEATVGDLRVDTARSEGKLDTIGDDIRFMKEAALHREKHTTETLAFHQKSMTETHAVAQKALVETQAVEQKALIETQAIEKRVTIEDGADAKKTRRDLTTKIAAVLAAIGAAITTYLAAR